MSDTEEQDVLSNENITIEVNEEPVAEEPVAEEPVAEEPVAEEPVAEEPVSEEPVSEEPVSEEPVAEEPVSEEPVAEEPVAEEPVSEEPVAEEPVAEEPVAEEPVSEEPVAEEPVVEEPVAEEPVVEEPVAEEPVSEEPVAEEPVVEEPVSEEPVAEEPVAEEPVAEEPVSEEPVAEEPVVEEPVAEEPVAEKPVVEEPVAEEPVVEEPVAEEPVSEESIVESVVEEPVAEEPVIQTKVIPKLVFIIPYRDREQQHKFFSKHMETILEDKSPGEYKMYYVHQTDTRDFNRGAMKNIGFIMIKNKYPDDYKNITLVFNDIDIMPLTKNFFNYETEVGVVKHFYGFEHTLGGIVSIKAVDFEKVNGFPNFWAWGYEDNLLQKRVENAGIKIDRSQFYHIMDKNILLLHDGITRVVNKREFDRYVQLTPEGFSSIRDLRFSVTADGFVNVHSFFTDTEPVAVENKNYDLRSGPKPFEIAPVQQRRRKAAMGMFM
jgi:hypothetical protein